jgi:hypothetical protein
MFKRTKRVFESYIGNGHGQTHIPRSRSPRRGGACVRSWVQHLAIVADKILRLPLFFTYVEGPGGFVHTLVLGGGEHFDLPSLAHRTLAFLVFSKLHRDFVLGAPRLEGLTQLVPVGLGASRRVAVVHFDTSL